MKLKDIRINNDLIARFAGWEFVNDDVDAFPNGYYLYKDKINGNAIATIDELDYRSEWGALMFVVEMIEKLGHLTIIGNTYCNIMYGVTETERQKLYTMFNTETKAMGVHKVKITAVYLAVVEFITWYNKQKNG